MKTLVTGGCGFIGSHLVELLIRDGHTVVVVDNLATGHLANLAGLPPGAPVTFVQADVADVDIITPHFQGVEIVFHLAGLADIVPSITTPLTYHRANVDGTAAVLEAARAASSTAAVPSTLARWYVRGVVIEGTMSARPARWNTISTPWKCGVMMSTSATSAWTNVTGAPGGRPARLARCPVARLSTTTTVCPSRIRSSTRWLPMNPQPPVTSVFTVSGRPLVSARRRERGTARPATRRDRSTGTCVNRTVAAGCRASSSPHRTWGSGRGARPPCAGSYAGARKRVNDARIDFAQRGA